jgi:hypothetical protein
MLQGLELFNVFQNTAYLMNDELRHHFLAPPGQCAYFNVHEADQDNRL